MRREAEGRPAILPFVLGRFSEGLRWLLPARATIGPPTRSVDRDLEDTWPSRGSGFWRTSRARPDKSPGACAWSMGRRYTSRHRVAAKWAPPLRQLLWVRSGF